MSKKDKAATNENAGEKSAIDAAISVADNLNNASAEGETNTSQGPETSEADITKDQPEENLSSGSENEQGPEPATAETDTQSQQQPKEDLRTAEVIMKEDWGKLPKQLGVLATSINQAFAQRETKSLPKLLNSDIMEMCANSAKGISIDVFYTNDENTSGYYMLKEFEHEVRVPAKGEFNFGRDMKRGR